MALGFRILPRTRAVCADRGERFRDLPVTDVSDVTSRAVTGTHNGSWVDATLRRLGCEGLE